MYFSARTESISTFRHPLRAAYRTAISAAQILVLCPNNAKLVGWGLGNGYGVCSNLASSGEPPPLLHMTTLTTDYNGHYIFLYLAYFPAITGLISSVLRT